MTRRRLGGLLALASRLSGAQLSMLQHPLRQAGTTAAYGAWLRGFLLTPDPSRAPARAALSQLAAPVHVIWGSLDELTPPADGRDLASLPRCATWDELPGVGHIPGLEAPALLAAALRARLDRPAPCARGTRRQSAAAPR
jgi:pimeloyl-ACP methyl ester carboxylesterase